MSPAPVIEAVDSETEPLYSTDESKKQLQSEEAVVEDVREDDDDDDEDDDDDDKEDDAQGADGSSKQSRSEKKSRKAMLKLGMKPVTDDDLADLAQVSLERPFARRRLPFPSGVFDAIHCGQCTIPWHSHEGKLLLEVNRILRPGGYFIFSTKHDSIEAEEEF
ncbi:hypothetical protein HRI_004033000 [Hibiscus trionum]|uniref:Methyltransferase n=1 Tax=Hibiscus trionum TaxID=183268 RepID=A0A9W7MGR8_HIBTR|nr:hypothetical protein HRI_004033000 [Hibiscus trionum]